MVTIKIGESEYKMPSSWKEVNIKQYIYINKVFKEEFGLMQIAKIISILSGCPIEKLYDVSLDDFKKIDFSWISKKIEPEIKNIIEIDGVRYGVIKNIKNITLAEYVDLEHYISNIDENLHRVCAILMRPIIQEDGELYIIEKYNHDSVEYRANIFLEKMDVVQLTSLADFFLNIANGYLENIVDYSKNQKMKKMIKKKKV